MNEDTYCEVCGGPCVNPWDILDALVMRAVPHLLNTCEKPDPASTPEGPQSVARGGDRTRTGDEPTGT